MKLIIGEKIQEYEARCRFLVQMKKLNKDLLSELDLNNVFK